MAARGTSIAAVLLLLCLSTGSSLISAGRILHESGPDQDAAGVPYTTADAIMADITAAADDAADAFADAAAKQGAVSRKIGRGPMVKKVGEVVPPLVSTENERPSQLTVIPGEGLVITTTGAGKSQQVALGSGEAAGSMSIVTLSDEGDLGAGGVIAENDPEGEKHAAEDVAAMMYRGMMVGTTEGAQPADNPALTSQTQALPASGSADAEAQEEVPQENNNEILVSIPGSDEVLHVFDTADGAANAGADAAAEQGAESRKLGRGPLVEKAEEVLPASASTTDERPSQLTVIPGEGLVITAMGAEVSTLSGAQQVALGDGEAGAVAAKGEAAASMSVVTLSDEGDLGAGGLMAGDDPDGEKHAAEDVANMMYRGMMVGTTEGVQPADNPALTSQTQALPASSSADAEAQEEAPLEENHEILVSVPGSDEVLHFFEKAETGDSSVASSSGSVTDRANDEESGTEASKGSGGDRSDGSRVVAQVEGARGSAQHSKSDEVPLLSSDEVSLVGTGEAELGKSTAAVVASLDDEGDNGPEDNNPILVSEDNLEVRHEIIAESELGAEDTEDEVLVAAGGGAEEVVEGRDGETVLVRPSPDSLLDDSVPVESDGAVNEAAQQEAVSSNAGETVESEAAAGSGDEAVTAEKVTGPHLMMVNDFMPEFKGEPKEGQGAEGLNVVGRVRAFVKKLKKAIL